jgi:hypothetical protein
MKIVGPYLILLLASALASHGQVTAEVLQDQEQFLVGEAIPTAVRITNRSGQTLHLGSDENWLTFSVESRDGSIVSRTGQVPVAGEFELATSKRATKHVDLAPYFNLTQPGRYEVVATVRVSDWNRDVTSKKKGFDVIEGAKMWEQEFGLPRPVNSSNSPPEVRRYILQEANHLKTQLRLYLRITDASGGKTFKVFAIGAMVSFSRPEPQLDRFNNLHVLYQTGPRTYSYNVFSPDGDVITQQTYDYVNSRPRLSLDADGNIAVRGGVHRLSQEEQEAAEPVPAVTPPNPSNTNRQSGDKHFQ